ncbi:MAG: histidine kinase [Gemmatimonadaceae bacterium]
MNRTRLLPAFWTLQLLGWAGYFVAMAFSRVGSFPLTYMFAQKALLTLLGVVISLALRAILRRELAAGRAMAAVVVTCVVASYGLAAVWTAAANLATVPIDKAFLGRTMEYDSIGTLFSGTVYNSFTLVAWGFLYLGLQHYARALRAETMAADAKLRALRYQLNPHLVFNTLNAISTLVAERRNDDATAMIARLGDFLRATLRDDQASEVPLAEELALATQYLDIEQVRFGDRLRVTYDIDEDAYRALVPVMLLQPLIENATRHGIAPLAAGGTICVSARVHEARLQLAVENSGAPASLAATTGIGLSNVRERLALLYGVRQSVQAGPLEDGGFRVSIDMPFVARS